MNNNELNTIWKNYFNWNILLFPILCFIMLIAFAFSVLSAFIGSTQYGDLAIVLLVGMVTICFFYIVWYFITSDKIFNELNLDRLLWNSVNVLLFFMFPILNFLVMTFILIVKLRNHWQEKNISYSWRGVLSHSK